MYNSILHYDIGHKKSLTMDFSQIPCFIKEAAIFNTINASLTVDLSSFDPSSNVKQLIISLCDGDIILPNHSFPSTLKTLHIYRTSNKSIDYQKLWRIGSNIEELYITPGNEMDLDDFNGFENMINLKRLIGINLNNSAMDKLDNTLQTKFMKSKIARKHNNITFYRKNYPLYILNTKYFKNNPSKDSIWSIVDDIEMMEFSPWELGIFAMVIAFGFTMNFSLWIKLYYSH